MKTNSNKAIELLFKPKAIAIVGASESTLYGRGVIEYLKHFGYNGQIFPINPKRDQIMGIKAYSSITKISEPIDVAIIIVGRKHVLNSLKECAEKGIQSIIVITAGFGEADNEGKQLEREMVDFAKKCNLKICGPNCAGVANFKDRVILCLLREEGRELLGGNVGFVSQSGALMMTLTGVARDRGIGLTFIASTGNECDLEVSDFMRYMVEDQDTQVITAFVEGFKDVHKFIEVADLALNKRKPLIVLKVGRSELGKNAAASHTAHLTGSDSAYDAIFSQKGVIRAADTYELFEIAKIFSAGKLPKGNGVLILTSSGGTGSLTADLCGDLGIHLPGITGSTLEKLLSIEGLLTFGNMDNPLDVRGQGMQIIDKVLPPILKDDKFSVILICLAFSSVGAGVAQKITPDIIELSKKTDKPIIVLWIGRKKKEGITDRECGFDVLEQNGIPVFEKPLTCLVAIKSLVEWTHFQRDSKKHIVISEASLSIDNKKLNDLFQAKKGPLNEFDSKSLLSLYGIPSTKEHLVTSVKDAVMAAQELGYPVVLKVMTNEITHKTEAGILALNIMDKNELSTQYHKILANAHRYNPNANIQGILVQEMIKEGIEVILGMSQDNQFGPVIMFGLGGIFVEVFKDVSFKVAPLTPYDAKAMIKGIKGFQILEGFRGKKRTDIESLIETILKFSNLCLDLKNDVTEIDINPLIVLEEGKGIKALDALVIRK